MGLPLAGRNAVSAVPLIPQAFALSTVSRCAPSSISVGATLALWAFVALWIETFLDTVANAALVHVDILRQDLRYALRTLRRAPGFAVTTIVVAALGIGATTAAFTMVNHVLIHPLTYPEPGPSGEVVRRPCPFWRQHVGHVAGQLPGLETPEHVI